MPGDLKATTNSSKDYPPSWLHQVLLEYKFWPMLRNLDIVDGWEGPSKRVWIRSSQPCIENVGKNLAELPSANILHGFSSKLGKIVTVAHLGPLGAKHSDETNDRVTPGL